MYSWGLWIIILHFWHQPEADCVPVSVERLEVLLVIDPLFASCTNGQATASCKRDTVDNTPPVRGYMEIMLESTPLFVFNSHSKSPFREQVYDGHHSGPYVLFMQITPASSRQEISDDACEPWYQIPSPSFHGDELMSPSHTHTHGRLKERLRFQNETLHLSLIPYDY